MTKKVLLINKTEITHVFLRVSLQGVAEVVSAYSLEEGLEILEKDNSIEAVFTEIYSVEKNVFKHPTENEVKDGVKKIISSIKNVTDIPVYVYTAQGMFGTEYISIEAGAEEFLLMCSENSRSQRLAELVDQL